MSNWGSFLGYYNWIVWTWTLTEENPSYRLLDACRAGLSRSNDVSVLHSFGLGKTFLFLSFHNKFKSFNATTVRFPVVFCCSRRNCFKINAKVKNTRKWFPGPNRIYLRPPAMTLDKGTSCRHKEKPEIKKFCLADCLGKSNFPQLYEFSFFGLSKKTGIQINSCENIVSKISDRNNPRSHPAAAPAAAPAWRAPSGRFIPRSYFKFEKSIFCNREKSVAHFVELSVIYLTTAPGMISIAGRTRFPEWFCLSDCFPLTTVELVPDVTKMIIFLKRAAPALLCSAFSFLI